MDAIFEIPIFATDFSDFHRYDLCLPDNFNKKEIIQIELSKKQVSLLAAN